MDLDSLPLMALPEEWLWGPRNSRNDGRCGLGGGVIRHGSQPPEPPQTLTPRGIGKLFCQKDELVEPAHDDCYLIALRYELSFYVLRCPKRHFWCGNDLNERQ